MRTTGQKSALPGEGITVMTIITAPRWMCQPEGEEEYSQKPVGPLIVSVAKTTKLAGRGGGGHCP